MISNKTAILILHETAISILLSLRWKKQLSNELDNLTIKANQYFSDYQTGHFTEPEAMQNFCEIINQISKLS